MESTQLFELFRQGLMFGLVLTLLNGFIPASLRAVWGIWNMVR